MAWSVLAHPEKKMISNWSSIFFGGGGGGGEQSNSYAKVESSLEIKGVTFQAHYLSEGVLDDLPYIPPVKLDLE